MSVWGEFKITDLFDLSLPSGDIQVGSIEDGDVPLVTPSNINNGIIKNISTNIKSTLYKSGSLTVDMFGNAYYQEKDFFATAHGHVNVLLPKFTLSKLCGLYCATSIKSMFLQKYGFKDMCTQKVLKLEKIKLPITSAGTPDWDYMENYMKTIMEETEDDLKLLA